MNFGRTKRDEPALPGLLVIHEEDMCNHHGFMPVFVYFLTYLIDWKKEEEKLVVNKVFSLLLSSDRSSCGYNLFFYCETFVT